MSLRCLQILCEPLTLPACSFRVEVRQYALISYPDSTPSRTRPLRTASSAVLKPDAQKPIMKIEELRGVRTFSFFDEAGCKVRRKGRYFPCGNCHWFGGIYRV